MSVAEQRAFARRFFNFINEKLEKSAYWNNSEEDLDNVIEGVEKLVMTKIYETAFCSPYSDDYEKDDILLKKVLLFGWIEPHHLDLKGEYNEAMIQAASKELERLNSFKSPRDKLICIMNSCKFMYNIQKDTKSADEFLPLLIYTILKTNPAKLHSNIEYISNYRNPEKLTSEYGYYLTNMIAATSFILKLDRNSLTIEQEEYERFSLVT
jgi:hypothetical protein